MEAPPVAMINTQRLKPFCQRTSRTVMSILDNGDISMEILAKPGAQDGNQMVQETIYISGDGTKMQIYQCNQEAAGEDRSEGKPVWSCQEYIFPDLPPKQMKKYMHANRFIELVKSRTPKIVLVTDRAKCKLMENTPSDFLVDFHGEGSFLLSKRRVHITDCDGKTTTTHLDSLSQNCPAEVVEQFHYLKQCESECLHLENSFNGLKAKEESAEFFPVTIGTTTSPVVIPLQQSAASPEDSLSSTLLHAGYAANQLEGERNSCYEPSSQFHHCGIVNDTVQPLPQFLDRLTNNTETVDLSTDGCASESSHYYLSPSTSSSTIPANQNSHFLQQMYEHNNRTDFHIEQNFGLHSLPNMEAGTTELFSPLVPRVHSDCCLERDDLESHTMSVPCSFDNFAPVSAPDLSTPKKEENSSSISNSQGINAPSVYNKFKYCSKTSPDVIDRDDNFQAQQESVKRELFVEQAEASNHCLCENVKAPSPQDCAYPGVSQTDSLNHLQQNIHFSSESEPSLASIHSMIPSLDNSILSQKTDSVPSSKRNSIASFSSSFLSATETSSNHITKEIIEKNDVFPFSPAHSSSLITSCSDTDLVQTHRKICRKVASPAISSLEKHVECLDLNASQIDDKVTQAHPMTRSEKQDIPIRSPCKITRNTNYNQSSVSTANVKVKSRPDYFNRSLPLWCDTRQLSVSNSIVTPQKQFLQSSDNEKGNYEFTFLPPQVRNSLDLSTSSNYSDSPSSSQSSSCEPLYQLFVPYTGWASYYASGAVWVLYNDGTQLGVKASEKAMTFIDQDGSQKKFNNKDIVPDVIKMKLEKLPAILDAVLQCQR